MRTTRQILMLLFVILLAACNSANPEADATVTAPAPALEEAPAPVTREVAPPPTLEPGAYPAGTPTPVNRLPEGYPEPIQPTLPSKYPTDADDGRVWILRPFGVQCVGEDTYEYASLDEAVRALEAAGMDVFGAEVIGLMVCESCDCPTSEHYRAQIGAENLATALSMGWLLEGDG